MSDIISVVKDALDIRNVSPVIVQKVPVLVKRSVIELQKSHILPPRSIEFISKDKKEEQRDLNQNFKYHYYKLPEDFYDLESFTVGRNDTPYYYKSTVQEVINKPDSDGRNYFTLKDINIHNDNPTYKILIANAFPKDDKSVQIEYYVDGSELSLDHFTETYWEVIIQKVESLIGIRTERDAEDKAIEVSSKWRNQQGKNSPNKTMTRTTPKFFGK
jgi:hypothetical protein